MSDVLFVEYPKCSTCKRAKAWLDAHGVAYTDRHIVEDNPTAEVWIANKLDTFFAQAESWLRTLLPQAQTAILTLTTGILGFINFLKKGEDGWLNLSFPQLDLTLRVKYSDSPKFKPLTYLWKEGVHAGKFKVKFREPVPVI